VPPEPLTEGPAFEPGASMGPRQTLSELTLEIGKGEEGGELEVRGGEGRMDPFLATMVTPPSARGLHILNDALLVFWSILGSWRALSGCRRRGGRCVHGLGWIGRRRFKVGIWSAHAS